MLRSFFRSFGFSSKTRFVPIYPSTLDTKNFQTPMPLLVLVHLFQLECPTQRLPNENEIRFLSFFSRALLCSILSPRQFPLQCEMIEDRMHWRVFRWWNPRKNFLYVLQAFIFHAPIHAIYLMLLLRFFQYREPRMKLWHSLSADSRQATTLYSFRQLFRNQHSSFFFHFDSIF